MDFSFWKRMLVGGIAAPFLAAGLGYLLAGRTSETPFRDSAIVAGMALSLFALMILFGTVYWRVSLNMLTSGIGWCFRTVFELIFNFDLAAVGIVLTPIGFVIAFIMAVVCIVIALGPYAVIIMGGMFLEGKLFSLWSGEYEVIWYSVIVGVNVLWWGIMHMAIPIIKIARGDD